MSWHKPPRDEAWRDVHLAYLAETDPKRLERAMKTVADKQASPCRGTKDFRTFLDDKKFWPIYERAEALAKAETTDTGKPLRLSRDIEIPRASSNFKFFATAAMQFASESHAMPSAIN